MPLPFPSEGPGPLQALQQEAAGLLHRLLQRPARGESCRYRRCEDAPRSVGVAGLDPRTL